jgi:hypothetical protein
MPFFTLQISASGPIADAFVGVSAGRMAALQHLQQPVPPPQQIRALIDTGASNTCIDPMVLQALGLQPTGQVQVHTPTTAGTPAVCNQYDISLLIPAPNGLPFSVPTTAVTEHQLFNAQGFHALIGRDVLSRCVLICNGQLSLFTLAY